MHLGPFNPLGPTIFLTPRNLKGAMPKDRDRQLPPGWQFDPPQISDPQTDPRTNANNAAYEVGVPYIQLPQDAMPLIPFTHVAIAYLASRQINAFLRSL